MVGRAKLKCLEGSVQILGHQLTPDDDDEVVVTSPFWSSWMTIQVAAETRVKLQMASIRGSPVSFRLVPPTRPTVIPPSWKTTVDQICQQVSKAPPSTRESLEADSAFQHPKQQVLICGAKGVGKSTLLRYATNRLLSSFPNIDQVAILDADVGQPELAPPGVLRLSLQQQPLLQPPYWNLCQPKTEQIASVFYGAVTSRVDPTRYIEGVQHLLQEYQDYVSHSPTPIPLLINMDGWVKGMGYQILTALISSIQPSHVCQILGESKGKQFELVDVIPKEGTSLFFLDACTNHVSPCSIPSSTLRTLRFGTYFGPHLVELWDALDFSPAKQLQTGWSDDECALARYLSQERPYCVPMEAVRCSWIGSDRQDLVEPDRILQAMNGSIVALCTATNNCLGLGIVRSIDWRRRVFFILTPVQEEALSNVIGLVGGNLPLPLPLMFRGVYAESFPYLTTRAGNVYPALGTEPMKSRNNIGRRGIA
jgi:polynucleotide 5'-hydroxyl-kinase GRC3/NOL9